MLFFFSLSLRLSHAEFTHWIPTRPGVVYSYVVEDPETKELTDMVSFYSLPSTILGHDKHSQLNACYMYARRQH